MKILMLNYEFPPLGGGAGNAMSYLLKAFALVPDVEIDVVTSSTDTFKIEQLSPRITLHLLDIGKRDTLHYQSMRELLSYSWKAYRYCRRLMSTKEFDLTHAFFGIPCGYVAMRLGLPYVVSLRGSDVPSYNKRFGLLDRLLFARISKRVWRNARAVVANSEQLQTLALATSPTQRISVIHNGVDTEEFAPTTKPVSAGKLSIISVGRLIERKGYFYLLEALAGLPGVELVLVGDGPLRKKLENMANARGVQTRFLGAVPHSEVVACLRAADVFVLPSLHEGMSNAVLEAMACGLPVIRTDTGGSREMVRSNGRVVPPADAQALRAAIEVYRSHPHLIVEHGAAARTLAMEMGWRSAAEQYRQVYDYELA